MGLGFLDSNVVQGILLADVWAGIVLLFAGYFVKGPRSQLLRIAGWIVFALYWPFQAPHFFWGDEPDPINGWFTLAGPLFLLWIAYHEWKSYKWGEDPAALRWFAGASAVSAATYFVIFQIPGVQLWIMKSTAEQSAWLYNVLFSHASGHTAYVPADSLTADGYDIRLTDSSDPYAVTVVLACTAVQSMMIFVGAIACLVASRRRKWGAYLMTVPTIYFLNLFRNAGIVYGYHDLQWSMFGLEPFEWMHSYVGKIGSLLALIVIALGVFTTLPELHSNILDLFDLRKRRAPGFFKQPPPKEPTSAPAPESSS
jgi:archaeosortase A (PGF-CTERM-specific)